MASKEIGIHTGTNWVATSFCDTILKFPVSGEPSSFVETEESEASMRDRLLSGYMYR